MRKVLFVSTLESTHWGGSEQLWSDMALQLLQEGHQVMSNTIEWPDVHPKITEIAQAGGKTTFRPNPHLGGGIMKRLSNKLQAGKWKAAIQSFAPDVMFINQGGTFDFALHVHGNWLRSLNIPYVVLSNFIPESLYVAPDGREFFPKFFSGAREVWFVSRHNKDVAERALAADIPNASVIVNPIKLQSAPNAFPPTTVWQMATVARLETEIKGYDILIECLAQPQWRGRSYRVNMYGSGPHLEYLQQLVAYKQLQEHIVFKGFVNDVTALWAENHMLLMPSRGEGTPLSLLEAGYCKRPALVTNVGGNADVITEGVNGFVADAPAISSFSDALERAWQQRESWAQLGINARKHVDELKATNAVQDAVKRFMG